MRERLSGDTSSTGLDVLLDLSCHAGPIESVSDQFSGSFYSHVSSLGSFSGTSTLRGYIERVYSFGGFSGSEHLEAICPFSPHL